MARQRVELLSRGLLAVTGLIYLLLGVAFSLWPREWALKVGLVLEHPDTVLEIRAVYGGLELGLGAFFAFCAWRRDWMLQGLWGLAFTYGGLASVRGLGLLAQGADGALQPQLLGVEASGTVLALLALYANRTGADSASEL